MKTPSLFLLVCLLGFPQISETIYTPSLPDLARSLGVGMNQVEYTLSIYFTGFAFGVLVFGILADLLGRRKSMLIGLSIYVVATFGCAFCHSIEALLCMRFFQAFGAAVGSVVTQTILRDLYQGPERSRVFAICSAALAFSPALGPVIGGFVDQLFSWKANFFVLTSIGIALWICSSARLIETRTAPPQITKNLLTSLMKKMLTDPTLYFYAFLIAGCNGIVFSYYAEAPFVFIELLGLTPSQYGLLGLVISVSFFLASFVSIRLSAKFSSMKTIAFGAGVALLGSVFMYLLSEMHAGITLWSCSILLVFTGVGIMVPNCLSHALSQYQAYSGSAGSLFGFAYYWMISGFTALMGIAHNGTSHAMPLYFCGISAVMVVLSVSRSWVHFPFAISKRAS